MTPRSSETLEKIARSVPIPEPAYERFQRRRHRKRRDQRIAAGVVGMAFFVAGIWIVASVGSLGRTQVAAGGAGTDAFISIRAQLTNDEAARNLFTVRADHAEYWRMYTLDRFNGVSWKSSDLMPMLVSGPPGHRGGTPPPGAETLDQTFEIVGDLPGLNALPMAPTAVAISGTVGDITWDPVRSEAFVDDDLQAGMTYRVRSQIVIPSADELDALQFDSLAEYGPWTQLPSNLNPRFAAIAQQWTAGETSDYRRVLAIQQHFHDGRFAYSTDVETTDDAHALLKFLTQTRTGFCQQYASAMAILVRALGLPARIAVGYQEGTLLDDGTYLVTTNDAHAWVEVLFPTYGWLPFEPTPGHGVLPNAAPGTYLNPVTPMGDS